VCTRPCRSQLRASVLAILVPIALASTPLAAAETGGATVSASSSSNFPYTLRTEHLDNGLTVVFVPTSHQGVMAYYTLIRAGSRNEIEPGHSGFAHLFEHMMFRGTEKLPEDERMKLEKNLGIDSNAWTSDDETVYTMTGPSEALPKVIELEADRFQFLHYSKDVFQTETKAVLGEYNKNFSNPAEKLEEVLLDHAFDKHTYKHTTMGFRADIEAMPTMYEYSQSFFKHYYRPDNAIIFVVGDFDAEATLAQIKTAYATWTGQADKPAIPEEPEQEAARAATVPWDNPTQPRFMVGYHSPGAAQGLAPLAVQDVLTSYLLGPTSAAHKTLVLERQVVESLQPWYSPHRDPRLWHYEVVLKDKKDMASVQTFVDGEVAKLRDGAVDARRFEAVKSNTRYSIYNELQTPPQIAGQLAHMTTLTGDPNTLSQLLGEVSKVTPADIVAFARTYLVDSNRTVVTLAPKVK